MKPSGSVTTQKEYGRRSGWKGGSGEEKKAGETFALPEMERFKTHQCVAFNLQHLQHLGLEGTTCGAQLHSPGTPVTLHPQPVIK